MSLNPIRTTRKLIGTLALDPSEDEPQQWETTGRVTRLKELVTMYPYLVAACVLFVGAILLFFYPVLPSAHRSGWTLAVGLYAVSVAVAFFKGRTKAYQTLRQYDLNFLFTGRHLVPRLGKRTGDIDDRLTGFKVLKEFSAGGLRTAFEEFRDRYGRREIADHKEKFHRAESDGSGEVVHGLLKNTTFDAEEMAYGIILFNSVSVTHAGSAEERLESKEMETVTSLPPVLDTRTSARVEGAFRAEKHARTNADQELSLVKDQLDRLEEHVDPAGQPLFERTLELVDQQRRIRDENDQPKNGSSPGTKGPKDQQWGEH